LSLKKTQTNHSQSIRLPTHSVGTAATIYGPKNDIQSKNKSIQKFTVKPNPFLQWDVLFVAIASAWNASKVFGPLSLALIENTMPDPQWLTGTV